MDSQSPEIDAAAGEDFVRIENATAEDLSESIVRVDEPRESNDALLTSGGAEEESDSERSTVLPEELTRSLVVLSCESLAGRGICDVYLVGTAHVSMVIDYLFLESLELKLYSGLSVRKFGNLRFPSWWIACIGYQLIAKVIKFFFFFGRNHAER